MNSSTAPLDLSYSNQHVCNSLHYAGTFGNAGFKGRGWEQERVVANRPLERTNPFSKTTADATVPFTPPPCFLPPCYSPP